jgi:hypothetical protein
MKIIAVLPKPDPLALYKEIAEKAMEKADHHVQVEISGDAEMEMLRRGMAGLKNGDKFSVTEPDNLADPRSAYVEYTGLRRGRPKGKKKAVPCA